jgi:hypothetical protein
MTEILKQINTRLKHGAGHNAMVREALLQARAWELGPDAEERAQRIAMYWDAERPRANWCAAFARHCAAKGGRVAPARGRAVRGARGAGRFYADTGAWVISPTDAKRLGACQLLPSQEPMPGDLIVWRRVVIGWQCHIAVVIDYDRDGDILTIVEGNTRVQDGPPRVMLRTLRGPQWRRRQAGLYGIARPSLAP